MLNYDFKQRNFVTDIHQTPKTSLLAGFTESDVSWSPPQRRPYPAAYGCTTEGTICSLGQDVPAGCCSSGSQTVLKRSSRQRLTPISNDSIPFKALIQEKSVPSFHPCQTRRCSLALWKQIHNQIEKLTASSTDDNSYFCVVVESDWDSALCFFVPLKLMHETSVCVVIWATCSAFFCQCFASLGHRTIYSFNTTRLQRRTVSVQVLIDFWLQSFTALSRFGSFGQQRLLLWPFCCKLPLFPSRWCHQRVHLNWTRKVHILKDSLNW